MAKKWSDLRSKMTPAQNEKIGQYRKDLVKEMSLSRLRAARELTQHNLASTLGVNQGEISKIEHRTDVYVSTLASYIQAMGGRLEIRAIFPEGETVKINQFEDLEPVL